MTKIEHLIENAIFAQGRDNIHYIDDWVEREKSKGNTEFISKTELSDIWTCAYYVIYSLFEGPKGFQKYLRYRDCSLECSEIIEDILDSYEMKERGPQND